MDNLNFVDIIILLVIFLGGIIGFRDGVIKRLASVIGMVLVIILSFNLKNYLSVIFYENLPFLKFGIFKSASVLNIIFYELLALLIVASILGIVYYLVLTITGIIEKILKATVILSIPSKILGFVVGLIENYLWVCIFLFVLTLPIIRIKDVDNSKVANYMLKNTPIISKYTGKITDLYNDVYDVMSNEETNNPSRKNELTLDLMLKYDFITVRSVDKLLEKNKITVMDDSFIDKYR